MEPKPKTSAPKPADANQDPAFLGLAQWLSGGFVLLTGLLTAVGSYTGGVARILRNDPSQLLQSLVGVFIAVILGVVAGEVARARPDAKALKSVLLIAGVASFLASMYWAISAAADSSSLKDRPSLSAQLVANDRGVWSVKGTAATSGLKSDDRLQVLVYALPAGGDDPVRIFFVTTGPNSDGVVSENFETPIPDGKFDVIVVTANTGTLPRDCAGNRAFFVQSDPVRLKEATQFVEEWQNACLTLAPPPRIPPS